MRTMLAAERSNSSHITHDACSPVRACLRCETMCIRSLGRRRGELGPRNGGFAALRRWSPEGELALDGGRRWLASAFAQSVSLHATTHADGVPELAQELVGVRRPECS